MIEYSKVCYKCGAKTSDNKTHIIIQDKCVGAMTGSNVEHAQLLYAHYIDAAQRYWTFALTLPRLDN